MIERSCEFVLGVVCCVWGEQVWYTAIGLLERLLTVGRVWVWSKGVSASFAVVRICLGVVVLGIHWPKSVC